MTTQDVRGEKGNVGIGDARFTHIQAAQAGGLVLHERLYACVVELLPATQRHMLQRQHALRDNCCRAHAYV